MQDNTHIITFQTSAMSPDIWKVTDLLLTEQLGTMIFFNKRDKFHVKKTKTW